MRRRHLSNYWCCFHSDCDPPVAKKPRTASVVVEQSGPTNKVLIDQVTDVDLNFDEVRINI